MEQLTGLGMLHHHLRGPHACVHISSSLHGKYQPSVTHHHPILQAFQQSLENRKGLNISASLFYKETKDKNAEGGQ